MSTPYRNPARRRFKRFIFGLRCQLFHRWSPWCKEARVCWACCEGNPDLSCARFLELYPERLIPDGWTEHRSRSLDTHLARSRTARTADPVSLWQVSWKADPRDPQLELAL